MYGAAWPVYAIAGGSCLLFAAACAMVRPYARASEVRGTGRILDAIRPGVLIPGMLEGARHVWREKTVFGALTLDLMAVLLGGATALMPVFATEILHVGPVGLGALKSAPFVGALVMALLLAHRRPFERAGRALLLSVAGFGVCTIAFGFSPWFWVSIAMLFVLGALDSISVVVRHVLVSVRTPDHLRGRVNAVNSVFIESSNELGGYESGALAQGAAHWLGAAGGAIFSVVFGGIGTMAVVGLVAWKLPELRRLGRLDIAKGDVEEAVEEREEEVTE